MELSLKAVLRLKGIEYPKHHDVGEVLVRVKEMYPKWFSDHVNKLADISRRLAEKREASMYGFEEAGLTPGELVTKDIARSAVDEASFVCQLTARLSKALK